ncbi:MAG: glycosyl hydrolase family 28-related protein, partial [Sporomusa sp.]
MKKSELRGSGPNPELFGVPATVVIDNKDAVNVKSFGAKGDGQTNDTAAIQTAVDAAAAGNSKVLVPDGVYMVDALQGVRLKSGVVFQMESGAILQAIPN